MLSGRSNPERVDTIVGKETLLNGTITGKGSVRIDGKVEGDIRYEGDVFVGETAIVKANIAARNLTIAGQVHGNVEIQGRLDLVSSGKLYGDLKAKTLQIADGATFIGKSETYDPQKQKQQEKNEGKG